MESFEALSSLVIVGLVVVAVVDLLKRILPQIHGSLTILTAALVGAVWALIDAQLGFMPDLNVAQGISAGLIASGAIAAKRA